MGCGKSATGRELARLTGMTLVEADREIERAEGMSIREIFDAKGEPAFRDMESALLKACAGRENTIISTGGGAVMRAENIEAMRMSGAIVRLIASAETILKRTERNQDRPLMDGPDQMARIVELLGAREPFYRQADMEVDTDNKTPLEVASEILERLQWKK